MRVFTGMGAHARRLSVSNNERARRSIISSMGAAHKRIESKRRKHFRKFWNGSPEIITLCHLDILYLSPWIWNIRYSSCSLFGIYIIFYAVARREILEQILKPLEKYPSVFIIENVKYVGTQNFWFLLIQVSDVFFYPMTLKKIMAASVTR